MCRLWAATGDGFMNRIVRLLADGSRIAAIFLPQKCPPPFDDGHVTFKYLPEPKLRHANSWHSSVLPGAVTTRLHQHLTRRRFLCAAQTKLEAASHQVPPSPTKVPRQFIAQKIFIHWRRFPLLAARRRASSTQSWLTTSPHNFPPSSSAMNVAHIERDTSISCFPSDDNLWLQIASFQHALFTRPTSNPHLIFTPSDSAHSSLFEHQISSTSHDPLILYRILTDAYLNLSMASSLRSPFLPGSSSSHT